MMKKLFLKELRNTSMFKTVDLIESRQSLILEIELNSLIGLYNKNVAIGLLKVHLILKPVSDNRIILENDYEKSSSYKVHLFANAYKHIFYHIGKVTNMLVEEMIMDIEQAMVKEIIK